MIDNSQSSNDLRLELFSGDQDTVSKALSKIKDSSCFDLIEPLFDLYVTTQKNDIKSKVFSLLCDVKDQRFVDFLILALSKPKYSGIKKEITGMCWQTGLDFSGKMSFFVDLLINGNDDVAIEAYSVFESSVDYITKEEKSSVKLLLSKETEAMSDFRKGLISETVYLFE